MKRHFSSAVIRSAIFWNMCAFFIALTSPLHQVVPLSAALCTAAGLAGLPLYVLPGTAAGCIAGTGGIGGILASLLACWGGRFLNRSTLNLYARTGLWALFCCMVPAVCFHIQDGTYTLACSIIASLIALAAAPVWATLFTDELILRTALTKDERICLHFFVCAIISGICRLYMPAGLFAAGAFALLLSGNGVSGAVLGAFTASLGLLMGDADALPCALLLFAGGISGLAWEYGHWAQSLLFLVGVPLSIYLGHSPQNAFLMGASVLYPFLPEAVCAPFRARFLVGGRRIVPPFRMVAARRHVPVKGETVCGDTGTIETLPDRRILLLLADGMGTGTAARAISERAAQEAGRLLRTSLDDFTAYRALNRLLMNGGSTFSTLETCVVDLRTGLAVFHKCGSETAWVLRGDRVKRISGASLPLGTLPEAPPSIRRVRLRAGDTVFLATDGLIGALGGESAAEALLLSLSACSPREICVRMLSEAQKRTNLRVSIRDELSAVSSEPPSENSSVIFVHPDDMSALCGRLVRRFSQEKATEPAAIPPKKSSGTSIHPGDMSALCGWLAQRFSQRKPAATSSKKSSDTRVSSDDTSALCG